jgi:hypothetical protein
MTDEQDRAEMLDDDVIADDEEERLPGPEDRTDHDPLFGPDDDRFAGMSALDEEYPPDEPLGVEDPGRYEIEDDLATRVARGEPDDEA